MKRNKGKLITFEGIEGSGKSTHARLLAHEMRAAGFKVVEVREPGGTRIGETIRLLLSKKGGREKMCPQTELLLFMASRAQLVQTVILPALRRGTHVICDRFYDSTSAYQGYARGFDLALITDMNAFAVQNLSPSFARKPCGLPQGRSSVASEAMKDKMASLASDGSAKMSRADAESARGASPDLTILLDLGLRAGFKRLHRRNRRHGTKKDRIESENMAFHKRVRNGYLDLAGKKPERFCVVNAGRPVAKVHADIWKAVRNVLEQ